jgi:hypothetical protein
MKSEAKALAAAGFGSTCARLDVSPWFLVQPVDVVHWRRHDKRKSVAESHDIKQTYHMLLMTEESKKIISSHQETTQSPHPAVTKEASEKKAKSCQDFNARESDVTTTLTE